MINLKNFIALECYIDILGEPVSYPSNSNQVIFTCPICGKNKLYLYLDTNTSWCFRCGAYKDYAGDITTPKELSTVKARLQGFDHITDHEGLRGIKIPDNFFDYETIKDNPEYGYYINYLISRGFDSYDITKNKLHFGHPMDLNTKNRILLPIFMHNILVFYQIRNLGDVKNKYVNPLKDESNCKTHILFNFDMAKLSKTVVVTEGIFDAMTIGSSAIATLGKKISKQQLKLIKDNWDTIILALDPDAMKENEENFKYLKSQGKVVKVLDLTGYKDVNEAGKKIVFNKINKLKNYNYQETDLLKLKLRGLR